MPRRPRRVALGDQKAALHGRAFKKAVKIARDVAQPVPPHDIAGLVEIAQRPEPRADRDICDGVRARDPVASLHRAVQHLQQALGLGAVAFLGARVFDLFSCEGVEISQLSEHRSDPAHLEHQPLQHFVTVFLRQKLSGLFRQIDQDRTTFEQRQRLSTRPTRIDDRGDLVVGVQGQEFGAHLVIGVEAHQMRIIGQAQFLKRDRHLDAVRRRQRIELDRTRRARCPPSCNGEIGKFCHRALQVQHTGHKARNFPGTKGCKNAQTMLTLSYPRRNGVLCGDKK